MYVGFSKKEKDLAIKLYKDGLTILSIAKKIGCNTGTITKWLKDTPKVKKIGPPKGNIPWNKNRQFPKMIGNKYAFIGDRGKIAAGHYRARMKIKEILPCEICNRILDKFMMVLHHKNENTLDNRRNNLMRLCRTCHINLHRDKLLKNRKYHGHQTTI